MVTLYHKLPSWTDYWKSGQELSVPFISSAMTWNRCAQILASLHINATVPEDNKDKPYKLCPLIAALNEKFEKLYNL
jgi:hypothetical protein